MLLYGGIVLVLRVTNNVRLLPRARTHSPWPGSGECVPGIGRKVHSFIHALRRAPGAAGSFSERR
jgi:hypothetical protein